MQLLKWLLSIELGVNVGDGRTLLASPKLPKPSGNGEYCEVGFQISFTLNFFISSKNLIAKKRPRSTTAFKIMLKYTNLVLLSNKLKHFNQTIKNFIKTSIKHDMTCVYIFLKKEIEHFLIRAGLCTGSKN